MSIDLATLELKIRSEGVTEAAENLSAFSGQAKTTETAAGKLSTRFTDLARTYGQLAQVHDPSPLGASLETMSQQLAAVDGELGNLSGRYAEQLAAFDEAQLRQRDSLYNGLLSEEEMLAQSYARRRELILESTLVTEEERLDLMQRLTQQYNSELANMENTRTRTLLSGAESMFDGLAGLAKTFSGKQSQAYRIMFAISKGFAVAQAALSIATGLAKAQELGFPANLGEMARVGAIGASIVAQINSSSYSGAYDQGGYIPGGKVGLVGEYGPELVRGPATVTGRLETARLARQPESAGGRTITVNATYVLQDKADFDQFRASRRQMDADLARNIKRAQV